MLFRLLPQMLDTPVFACLHTVVNHLDVSSVVHTTVCSTIFTLSLIALTDFLSRIGLLRTFL